MMIKVSESPRRCDSRPLCPLCAARAADYLASGLRTSVFIPCFYFLRGRRHHYAACWVLGGVGVLVLVTDDKGSESLRSCDSRPGTRAPCAAQLTEQSVVTDLRTSVLYSFLFSTQQGAMCYAASWGAALFWLTI